MKGRSRRASLVAIGSVVAVVMILLVIPFEMTLIPMAGNNWDGPDTS